MGEKESSSSYNDKCDEWSRSSLLVEKELSLCVLNSTCSNSNSLSPSNTSTCTSSPIPIRRISKLATRALLPTTDGYTLSHSLLVENLPTDSYGFILDERFGINQQTYGQFEKAYAAKYERQVQRWGRLITHSRNDLVVFPPLSNKIKRALRKGLPRELRSKAWYFYSGAQSRHDAAPTKYKELVKTAIASMNSALAGQIESDIRHTFANNRCFATLSIATPFPNATATGHPVETPSQAALRRLLMATAFNFPSIGYAAGLHTIAATLLLVTQDEVRSFWILVCILEKLLPENFYADMNLGCNVEQEVLTSLIAWKLSHVHQKLQELDMSLHIVISTWFTQLFVDQLPFETLLRVWDCFLHEGCKVLLRVALALFKINQNEILAINDPFELAAYIKNMPRKQLNVMQLMDMAFNGVGSFSSTWLQEERARVLPQWKAKHAVRRFSRVSPAYCQAHQVANQGSQPLFCAPVVLAELPSNEQQQQQQQQPMKILLADEMPIFEHPEEIESLKSSTSSPVP